jgi:hypothetical protein
MMNNYEHDVETNVEMRSFLERFHAMLLGLMGDGNDREQAHLRAMAYMGVMESFKNELFRLPETVVDQQWIEARAAFSAALFSTSNFIQ